MIDYFSIALTHGLILLACWRLLFRDELDAEGEVRPRSPRPWLRREEGGKDA
ncbi:hypothetical protein [Aurantiacibacter hainanensis]|uniref:hypothetical protein n=1 Tax=Aurantiacibacter hainanensis TaxID=3076114 RepID=UPI0030C68B11